MASFDQLFQDGDGNGLNDDSEETFSIALCKPLIECGFAQKPILLSMVLRTRSTPLSGACNAGNSIVDSTRPEIARQPAPASRLACRPSPSSGRSSVLDVGVFELKRSLRQLRRRANVNAELPRRSRGSAHQSPIRRF